MRESWSAGEVTRIPRQVLPAKALVLAITSLLDARFRDAGTDLHSRGLQVVTLIVSPLRVVAETVPTDRG